MKNYLIVYMSHHGTTRKVAKQIQEKLGIENAAIVDLEKEGILNLNEYKTILIGGSIYMGSLQKKIRLFMEKNQKLLLKKKIGLFICFMNKKDSLAEFDKAFPEILRNVAIAKGFFGGELIFKELNFIEKFIVKYVSGVNADISDLDGNAIDKFAEIVADYDYSESVHTIEN